MNRADEEEQPQEIPNSTTFILQIDFVLRDLYSEAECTASSRSMVPGSLLLCLLSPQGLVQGVDELLQIPEDLEDLPRSDQHCVATNLLVGLEDSLRNMSQALPNGTLTFNASAGTGKCWALPQAPAPPFITSFIPWGQ